MTGVAVVAEANRDDGELPEERSPASQTLCIGLNRRRSCAARPCWRRSAPLAALAREKAA